MFRHVAAGQAAGTVSQRQAHVIVSTIEGWPAQVQADHGDQAEHDLVGHAARLDPVQLGRVAERISAYVDADGTLDADRTAAQRSLYLDNGPAGTSTPRGRFSAELTERLKTFFDVAAPQPASADGVTDSRTVGLRQHDALCDLLERSVRTGQVPSNNGVSATVVITMSYEQYLTGDGLARTGHGALVPAAQALRWSGGDTEVLGAVLGSMRAVSHYSDTHRIYTERQRRVLAARDRGCSFPSCVEPPGRCQINHVIEHQHGGPTSITNGALECRYHHREATNLGWARAMIDGRPHWIPPAVIDPRRRPVRNTLHDDHPAA